MARRNPGSTGAQRVSLSSGSEVQYSSMDVVDSLLYYFENTVNMELPEEASDLAHAVARESASTWRLLVEIFRMEALADRLRDQMGDSKNALRDGFLSHPSFRRLLALVRWAHWLNTQEQRSSDETVTASKSAYPQTSGLGSELPLDTVLRQPQLIHPSDLAKEHQLCRKAWTLLTEGRVMDAIELCSNTGHHWRAGVLHAASAHALMAEESTDDLEADWVESVLSTDTSDIETRFRVKWVAREILDSSKCVSGIDDHDTAITAYLCGDEERMRRIVAESSFGLNLFVALHALKEDFASYLLGESSARFSDSRDPDSILSTSIASTLSSLPMSNQFQQVQADLVAGRYTKVLTTLVDWTMDGIVTVDGEECDIDLSSPSVDAAAAVLVRSFASALVTALRDLVAPESDFDLEAVSSIIVGNVESVVAQLKSAHELLDGHDVVVENLSLLTDAKIKTKTWAWFLRQFQAEWLEWTVDSSFSPLVSLLETMPAGSVAVVQLLLADAVSRRLDTILSHSVGTSIEAGKEIGFALGCVNSLWLTAQMAAKSTGNGVYLDIAAGGEDPDEAAAGFVTVLGNLVGEGLLVLMLADLHATRSYVALTKSAPHRLLSIQAALDTVNTEDENDVLGVVSSFVQVLDRVTLLMERNALLEQQRANLAKLTGRSRSAIAASTDARRQIIEAQRLADSSTETIEKLADEIVHSFMEYLTMGVCPVNVDKSFIGLSEWRSVVTAAVDVVAESCVQAVALVDDRKRQELLVKHMRNCQWLNQLLGQRRVETILEEIA